MRLSSMCEYDGIVYPAGSEIPDLGSWVRTNPEEKGMKRDYEGLSKDIGKLPKYVATGSSAFCIDTGDILKFHESTKEWHPID